MPSQRFFTSESVTEGHPDKICDQISDAILDDLLKQDRTSRVAVETLVTTGQVHVVGEVTTEGYAEIADIVRKKIVDIGYRSSEIGFDGNSCGVSVSLDRQSPEIAEGVNHSLEERDSGEKDPLESQGAGDQGIMFGFACNETPTLMPLPITLAHRLAEQLAKVRHSGELEFLRPDGKTQVTVAYENQVPVGISTVVVSSQHSDEVSNKAIDEAITKTVVVPVLQDFGFDANLSKVLINPSGRFIIGGPHADSGLTGRKIIVDTYGGYARHGGGAFSGKDPSKVDRSAAYAMRWVAKNVVAAGLADKVEVQVAYAIGKSHPVGLYVETFGTNKIDHEKIENAIREVFDLRPAAIIRDLDLLRPIYSTTASYGHFGRELTDFTWERLDRVEQLRQATGI